MITGVSGMGSSSARMMLSSMTAEELRNAILSEDINKIKSVKGIGLKSAQRLILELKDKIVKGEGVSNETLFAVENNAAVDEATTALQMLGFAKPNINKAIQAVGEKEGFTYIFDLSQAGILYFSPQQCDDVFPFVKAELGF